jgi:exodeoxyribonuclease V alpha subunit
MLMTRNLLYTAVTRAKKIAVLVGTQDRLKRMIKNKHTAARYTMLHELLLSAEKKHGALDL